MKNGVIRKRDILRVPLIGGYLLLSGEYSRRLKTRDGFLEWKEQKYRLSS